MGRPAKNNAEYFPHYTSMRNHRKIKALRNKFGAVLGYAFWSLMLEWLTEQDGIEWEYSDLECEMFAAELGVSAAEIREMVDFCIKIELLFKTDSGFVYSDSLNEMLKAVFEKRKRERDKSKTRKRRESGQFVSNNPTSDGVSAAEIPQSKVEYSKEDKNNTKKEAATPCSDTPSKAQEILSHTIPDIQDPKSPLSKKELSGKDAFEEARKSYPGTKRGDKTEWDNFEKKYKKHPDFKILPGLIKTAIEKQKKHRLAMVAAKERFIPEWPYFSTWINQQRWEEEIENFSKEPEPAETSTKRMTDAEYYELMGMLPDEETEIITPKFSLQ